MDINEYIASGSIENYVLGIASEQERQEVECMSHIYPEIKSALTAFQTSIENLSLKAATPPPLELKRRVLAQIKTELQDNIREETEIVPIQKNKGIKTLEWSRIIAAASIVLLIGVSYYAYKINSDLNRAEGEIVKSDSVYDEMVNDYNALSQSKLDVSQELAALTDQMNFVRDQNTEKVILNGTDNYSDNLAAVYWNPGSEKVMLDLQNMQSTSSEESYQLWVLVDGAPIDMGVFDFELEVDSVGLLEMKTTATADAFAITLEPSGGSILPTLDQLVVIGNV
jgi:anti-sigma-K factor RskA